MIMVGVPALDSATALILCWIEITLTLSLVTRPERSPPFVATSPTVRLC